MRIRPVTTAIVLIAALVTGLSSFTTKQPAKKHRVLRPDDGGKALFTTYCAACHLLPDPTSLTKDIWTVHVLPVMAARMGIIYPNYDPLRGLSAEERAIVKKNNIIPDQPVLTQEEWGNLVKYVVSLAPDTVGADDSRLTRNKTLTQFKREDIQVSAQGPSMITGLGFDTLNKTLFIGNFFKEVLTWKYSIGVTKTIQTESPVVDFKFDKGNAYFTEIGKLYPTELSLGSIISYKNDSSSVLLSQLHRPVNTQVADLNNDGILEMVVCNFGNKTGGLSLFKKNKAGNYTEDVLMPLAGAIKCYVRDMDGDGKKDIVAMFSQGDESVYVFYQKDNLKFKAKRVLRFPPNYGTTDMVLVDYNHDGLTDIITVHGDNADYSQMLKAYHGIRININQGNSVFKEQFFYPIYGITRVLGEDFDKDGDIDLACSAFFPDFGKLVDESFVYLENVDQKNFKFKSYIQKSDIPLKSLTLIKADIDGDGDMDIIAGNFAQSPGAVPPVLDEKWKNAKHGITLFLNQLYNGEKK
jgi:hypothetical protein